MEVIIFAVIVVGLFVFGLRAFSRYINAKGRRAYLSAKYDNETVNRLMERKIRQGMTGDQLLDSWGAPEDIGSKILKRKTVEIYKYNRTGHNRYAARVTLENGIVVGWEQK